MKRFLILPVSALMLGTLATTAYCGYGHSYVRGSLGYNVLDDLDYTVSSYDEHLFDGFAGFDEGVHFSGALGYQYDIYRLDAEISYAENTINTVTGVMGPGKVVENFDGNMNVMSAMANAYVNCPADWFASPYLGIGVGSANVEVEGTDQSGYGFDDNTAVFAYQGSLGVLFKLTPKFEIDAGYRYFKTNDFSLQRIVEGTKYRYETNYEADIYMVGLKYNF